jgi:hypothetical protein
VALVVVGNGLDGFGWRFGHGRLRCACRENAGCGGGVPGTSTVAHLPPLALPDGQITPLNGLAPP